jgi:hypothetical protein
MAVEPMVLAPPLKEMFPAIVAVGVPPAIFVTANLADEVVVPPIRKSKVEFPGYNAPSAEFHHDPPLVVESIPVTSVARLTADEVKVPVASE